MHDYMESFESLDWLVPGQQQAGLDVQLPGSENLLPTQNGFLVEPTATLSPKIKDHSKVDDFLDIKLDDDCNGFVAAVLHAPKDFLDNEFVLDVDTLLPSSPEFDSFDFNSIVEQQRIYNETWHCRNPSTGSSSSAENLEDQGHRSTPAVGENLRVYDHLANDVQEDIFECNRLCDFDADWLFSSVPILPSLEEVESVLSASSFCTSEDESLESTEFEIRSSETSVGNNYLDSVHLPGSPLSILLANQSIIDSTGATADCSVQFSPNLSWSGNGMLGDSLAPCNGFTGIKSSLAIVTSSESLPPLLESNCVGSPFFSEDQGYGSSPMSTRSSPITVRVGPYPTSQVKPERRERKREQNKTAALKYRQKKRAEQGVYVSECEQLEKRNSELKSRVEELTREISYLKGLISEIYSSQAE